MKTKDDSALCIHCDIEFLDVDIANGCPKCGKDDFEEVATEEWESLSEEEKEVILQQEEDVNWYNSVRL